ncbi:hypothetical protein NDU88_003714 [Pleurodeles waltl]|uniref:Uncharacterized protein n=1 Tax=Pleurodeles waltl TaxID=8319 RepID=A0AAV7VEZ4_PLEWA|nr:hypothetical protein NDU88_003714 [Pleurodeles waltl]
MELDINATESYSMAELKKLYQKRGLKILRGYPKFENQIALKAWEQVCRMQAPVLDNYNEEDAVDEKEEEIKIEDDCFEKALGLEKKVLLFPLALEPERVGDQLE